MGDLELQLLKDYAQYYENLTEEQAKDIAKRSFELDEKTIKLKKKYFKKLEKEMTAITAARFFQLENQILLLMDLQVAMNLPLIK